LGGELRTAEEYHVKVYAMFKGDICQSRINDNAEVEEIWIDDTELGSSNNDSRFVQKYHSTHELYSHICSTVTKLLTHNLLGLQISVLNLYIQHLHFQQQSRCYIMLHKYLN
jgi:hypothetical protein